MNLAKLYDARSYARTVFTAVSGTALGMVLARFFWTPAGAVFLAIYWALSAFWLGHVEFKTSEAEKEAKR